MPHAQPAPLGQTVDWVALVAKYSTPSLARSLWQVVNTILPFCGLWYLMYRSLDYSYWLTLALAIPTSGLLARIFIILHDCGHGSFFKSTTANDLLGQFCGVLTFTPYFQWRHLHAIHHATSGDLDRRGTGDIKTLTVREYLALTRWRRLGYRWYRSAFTVLLLSPLLTFLVVHRFVARKSGRRERIGVHLTNLALAAVLGCLGWLIGFQNLLLIQLPLCLITFTAGVWLFYVQHQFEDTYWEQHQNWQYVPAAMRGSSYFRLPAVLQWFTGNIGFHHIHHLSPKIPNYNLPRAFAENPSFQQVTIITLWESFRTISLKLWDEDQHRLVGFSRLNATPAG